MDLMSIHDKKQLLKFAVDDLNAVRSIILTVGDHEEYANAYEAMRVIDRALSPIIGDIQGAIEAIDTALKKEKDVQQDRPGVSETA